MQTDQPRFHWTGWIGSRNRLPLSQLSQSGHSPPLVDNESGCYRALRQLAEVFEEHKWVLFRKLVEIDVGTTSLQCAIVRRKGCKYW